MQSVFILRFVLLCELSNQKYFFCYFSSCKLLLPPFFYIANFIFSKIYHFELHCSPFCLFYPLPPFIFNKTLKLLKNSQVRLLLLRILESTKNSLFRHFENFPLSSIFLFLCSCLNYPRLPCEMPEKARKI